MDKEKDMFRIALRFFVAVVIAFSFCCRTAAQEEFEDEEEEERITIGGFNEVSLDPAYLTKTLNLTLEVEHSSVSSAELAKFLRLAGVTHIYIGQIQGLAPYTAQALLDPEQFAASPFYELLYHLDHVWIFALKAG